MTEVTITGDCPHDECKNGTVPGFHEYKECPACNGTSYATVTTTFGDILDSLERFKERTEECHSALEDAFLVATDDSLHEDEVQGAVEDRIKEVLDVE